MSIDKYSRSSNIRTFLIYQEVIKLLCQYNTLLVRFVTANIRLFYLKHASDQDIFFGIAHYFQCPITILCILSLLFSLFDCISEMIKQYGLLNIRVILSGYYPINPMFLLIFCLLIKKNNFANLYKPILSCVFYHLQFNFCLQILDVSNYSIHLKLNFNLYKN